MVRRKTPHEPNGGSQCQSLRRSHRPHRRRLCPLQSPHAQTSGEPKSKKTDAGSKQSRVIAMLQSPDGTTIAAMMKATGWQQHSVRGFLAGVVRKKLKLKLNSKKIDGTRVYSIDGADSGKASAPAIEAPRSLTDMPRVKVGPALPDTKTLDVEIARLRDLDVRDASGPLAQRVPAATAPSPAPPSSVSCSGLSASGRSSRRSGCREPAAARWCGTSRRCRQARDGPEPPDR